MNNFTFRPAYRENVGVFIGLAAGTGGGKTMSAMRIAQGVVGRNKSFAVIDTEGRRATHYAPKKGQQPDFVTTFRFDHMELEAPFTPENYAQAIKAAIDGGYPCIVVDSMSHEHEGEGGLLDMAEAELERMAGSDWKKREACVQASWIKPKAAHKKMMRTVLQPKVLVILCFRAESKTELVRGENGKMTMAPKKSLTGLDGWIPICEKKLPFELTASFLLTADAPGIPKPIKLNGQHRDMLPLDRPIDEDFGKAIAAWASDAGEPEPVIPAKEKTISKDEKILSQAIKEAKDMSSLKSAFEFAQDHARDMKDNDMKQRFIMFKDVRKRELSVSATKQDSPVGPEEYR